MQDVFSHTQTTIQSYTEDTTEHVLLVSCELHNAKGLKANLTGIFGT